MCLLVLAWNSDPRYRLVVAANRDEFHDRPAAPLDWWPDPPVVLAGRDLRGGGTWMGVSRSGRFGAVTNFRELERAPPEAPSRGQLVTQFLAASSSPGDYLGELGPGANRYAGFNLLVGAAGELQYFCNRNGAAARPLGAGVYGLSNHWLDSPWPKLLRTRAQLSQLVGTSKLGAAALFDLLADRTPADLDETPDTGLPPDWERALSAPFVVHERYGTRCSTVLLVEHSGRTTLFERRFDHQGREVGAASFDLPGAPG